MNQSGHQVKESSEHPWSGQQPEAQHLELVDHPFLKNAKVLSQLLMEEDLKVHIPQWYVGVPPAINGLKTIRKGSLHYIFLSGQLSKIIPKFYWV